MTIRIRNSLGFGGTNDPADVELVQRVLRDRVSEDAGGPQPGFGVTGRCDGTASDPTVVAIKKFPSRQLRTPVGGANRRPDGRLDPGGFSLRRLSAYDPGPGLVPPIPLGHAGGGASLCSSRRCGARSRTIVASPSRTGRKGARLRRRSTPGAWRRPSYGWRFSGKNRTSETGLVDSAAEGPFLRDSVR